MTRPDDASIARPWIVATLLAAVVGLFLLQGPIHAYSATYDEVTYLKVAATWWRTGEQDSITRMGSPLTFWKLQQIPAFQCLDGPTTGRLWLEYPLLHQETLLPIVRTGACWLWGAGFLVTIRWARRCYGLRAMAAAAWLYTLSPNLLAHGALITMETPLVATSAAMFAAFAKFLEGGRRRFFFLSAVMAGAAFSCKFTAVVFPPILGAAWFVEAIFRGDRRWLRAAFRVSGGMIAFGLVMIVVNLLLTGFATIPLSENVGDHPIVNGRFGPSSDRFASRLLETPLPQDWVGFARQMSHQRGGGSSYLFGERRMKGWWYYYFVCLAVKVPLTVGLMVGARLLLLRPPRRTAEDDRTNPLRWHGDERLIAITVVLFLLLVSLTSSRNYGVRYLLPLAPLVIVWCSGLAESGRVGRLVLLAGLAGQAAAVTTIYPYELSYFNPLAGGKTGGRHILADSNLDWGQGLLQLVKWQRTQVDYKDLTTYYFGNTCPYLYRLIGKTYAIDAGTDHPELPDRFTATTPYVAVSASLQYGPWGPKGYFDRLSHVKPFAMTDDGTIAIYRTADIPPSSPRTGGSRRKPITPGSQGESS